MTTINRTAVIRDPEMADTPLRVNDRRTSLPGGFHELSETPCLISLNIKAEEQDRKAGLALKKAIRSTREGRNASVEFRQETGKGGEFITVSVYGDAEHTTENYLERVRESVAETLREQGYEVRLGLTRPDGSQFEPNTG